MHSFRSAAVEFLNKIIDKHNLQQEKVKAAFVVHPGGRKFMSLVLDLIQLAILEVMKKKNYETEKSIDIENTASLAEKMQESDKNFQEIIELEISKFKRICDSIELLFVDRIMPADSLVVVENFMENWNDFNKATNAKIKSTDCLVTKTAKSAERLLENATKMLSFTNKDIDEMSSDADNKSGDSLPVILRAVQRLLPVIVDFIRKFYSSLDFNQQSALEGERKFVSEKFDSLSAILSGLKDISVRMDTSVKPWIEKMEKKKRDDKNAKEEEEPEYMIALKAERERKDQELMSLLRRPNYTLNVHAAIENETCRRISLKEEISSKPQNKLNETALYRMPRVSVIKKAPRVPTIGCNSSFLMKPPASSSVLGRINTRDLLERATSRPPRQLRPDQSRYLGVVPKIITPKMSSTMLSTDQEHGLFDCTGVSEIRSNYSPMIESPREDDTPLKPAAVAAIDAFVTPMMKSEDISPRRKLISQFEKEPKMDQNSPTLEIPTVQNILESDESEKTISNEKSSSGSNGTCIDSTFAAFQLKNDEDLFDVSDTVLNDFDSPL